MKRGNSFMGGGDYNFIERTLPSASYWIRHVITLKLENDNNKSNIITWDEKFTNGSSSVDESSFSLVTKLGYKLVKAANLDWPPYICEPATNICVLRLKPRAASISIASSGVKGHRPSDLSSAGEGNLQRFKNFD